MWSGSGLWFVPRTSQRATPEQRRQARICSRLKDRPSHSTLLSPDRVAVPLSGSLLKYRVAVEKLTHRKMPEKTLQ
jgi:hypothetical protein